MILQIMLTTCSFSLAFAVLPSFKSQLLLELWLVQMYFWRSFPVMVQ
jgi:hypothetical protein